MRVLREHADDACYLNVKDKWINKCQDKLLVQGLLLLLLQVKTNFEVVGVQIRTLIDQTEEFI